jgi:predicted dehydrogenase
MPEPIGVALIGTGFWGRRLGAAVQRVPELALVTCYSRDEAKRNSFASDFGCEAAATFDRAIEHPRVQGVLLVTPNHRHREGALAAVARGKHLFVEKPIADELAEAREMRAACRAASLTLMVGHCFRRLGAARKVKQLLEEGALGEVVLAEANFSLPGSLTPDKWRFYRETCPGGPLMQLGIHHADTLQYWLGPVQRVWGSFAHLVTEAEIDDVGVAVLEFANGAKGSLASSYVSPKTFSLRLYGSEAVLDYQTDMSVWPKAEEMDPATVLTLRTNAGSEQIPFQPHDMLAEELSEFAACMRGEAAPETGVDEALLALEVITGAIEAQCTGKAYSLSETTAMQQTEAR